MDDESIVAAMKARGMSESAVGIARFLEEQLGRPVTQGALVTYFKRAFPAIPLRTLLEAGAWERVSGGGMSDSQFNELLAPWLEGRSEGAGDAE